MGTSLQAISSVTAASRPSGNMVRVDGVTCVFDRVRAVDAASFALARGRFLTILGPSGSGKTTLLRMIAGFIRPTAGEIFIAEQPVSAVPPHRRSIGMVFQRLALFPHMTAAENVAYPLKMRRFDPKTIPDRVETYLKLVRLPGYGARRIHELSGGQQQRVAIARALVFEPDLLLLDEPLAALDRKLREDMQLEFRRIQQELGVTTINVTHDQREALVMSDEIIVMESGKIEQNARPLDTYRKPASRFVAGFIGVTNFLAAVVKAVAADGTVRLAVGNTELQARAPAATLSPGQAVEAALRAEQIRLGAERPAMAGLTQLFDGRVEEIIFEGDRIVYGVRCPALGDTLLRLFDHDPLHHRSHVAGDAVVIGWNASDLMIFPR